jgi:hypothetical protein
LGRVTFARAVRTKQNRGIAKVNAKRKSRGDRLIPVFPAKQLIMRNKMQSFAPTKEQQYDGSSQKNADRHTRL